MEISHFMHVFFAGFLSSAHMSQRIVCGSVLLLFVCMLSDMFSSRKSSLDLMNITQCCTTVYLEVGLHFTL